MAKRAFSDFIGFSRASAAWRFNSSGVLVQEAANVPRDDYDSVSCLWNGLLIEEARTNTIRNSSVVGAVAGTPGTTPTNWVLSAASGLAWSVVATGSEDGIPYVDFRLQGTASATSYHSVSFETAAPAASIGQAWSISAFIKLVAGSFANVGYSAAEGLRIAEYDSVPAYLGSTGSDIRAIALGAKLSGNRVTHVRTVALPGAATVRPQLQFAVASGGVVDVTLRIGIPQFELGAFPTSPILTTNAQVTRAADTVAVGSLPPWFNPSEGTLYIEIAPGAAAGIAGSFPGIFDLSDGGTSNRISSFLSVYGTPASSLKVVSGGVTQANPGGGSAAASVGGVYRVALAYKTGDATLCANGGAIVATTPTSLPTGLNRLIIGNADKPLNGWLRALKYNPRRMTNAELQAMTSLPNANGPTLAFDFKAKTFNLEHI